MTIAQILIVLRARWRLALLVLLTVVASVAALSLLMKPQYTAVASVVLDVKSPDPIAGVVLPGMTVPGYMGTQLGVIQSERVALRALKALHADTDPVLRRQWQDEAEGRGDFAAWLAEQTLRRLDVVPARDSNVIMVSYRSPDPLFSAAVANAFVQAYIDTTLELRVDPAKQFSNVFDGSAKRLREDLERAQAKLSAYQQSKGIVASDEKLDIENLRFAELSSQLVVLQGVANESGGRQSQSAGKADRMQEVLNNPLVVNLNSDLSRQEGKLKELTSNFGENHPQVIELRASIAQLRSRIAAETQRVAGSLTVNNDVNQARLAQLRSAMDEQRTKLLRLKGQRDESAVLLREVENAQRAYDMVLGRAAQSGVESQTTQTNVSVLKNATPPARPSSPRVVLNLAVAGLIGALLAVAAALLRESSDRRLRTDADVIEALRQPLLGVLPVRQSARSNGRSRLRLTLRAAGVPPRLAGR